MERYLKHRQEYLDEYDRETVRQCREHEVLFKKAPAEANPELPNRALRLLSDVAIYFALLQTTVERYEHREKTVNDWMRRDAEFDQLLETAKAPERIRCLTCGNLAQPSLKTIDLAEDRPRVLFVYDCPKLCKPRRAFFHDGREFRPRRKPCPRCGADLVLTRDASAKEKIIVVESCSKCGYAVTDEIAASLEQQTPDPNFASDRARFCLTKEQYDEKSREMWHHERMSDSTKEQVQEERRRKNSEAISTIKKLTITELEKLLGSIAENAGYAKFQLGAPRIARDLSVPFTVQDSKPDRIEHRSTKELKKLLESALAESNWRLMSAGITYRLGVLSGDLRAYEKDEDLLELVRLKRKKETVNVRP